MSSRFQLAQADIVQGLKSWRIWLLLGWQDIRIRYRRSILGPFWITLSMGVIICTMGLLYGHLFKVNLQEYLPFLAAGMLAWSFISTMLIESPTMFVDSHLFIKQVKLPYTVFVMRMITRNTIIFLHNILIVVPVILFFHITIGWSILVAIWGLFLIMATAFFYGLILACLNARYRDINPIIASLVQILFFLSPIMWPPQNLPARYSYVVQYNPIAQYVGLLREPLLGHAPSLHTLLFTLGVTFFGTVLAVLFFVRSRHRIVFWL